MSYSITKLHISHVAFEFCSGDSEIDRFFENSYEEMERGNSIVYVMLDQTQEQLVGFFAICMTSVYTELDRVEVRWPAALIGQLGINRKFQSQGYGPKLVKEAIQIIRNLSRDIACRAVIIHTYKADMVGTFFKKCGFQLFETRKIDNRIRYDLIYDIMTSEDLD